MATNTGLSVEIQGLDKLIRKMEKVQSGLYLKDALKAGGETLKDAMVKYPPGTDANNPSNRRWYKRGEGQMYRSAAGVLKSYGGSEDLKSQWEVQPDQYKVTVKNPVSYGIYVQDDRFQAKIHRKNGWQRLGETAKDKAGEILKDVERAFLMMWDNAQ